MSTDLDIGVWVNINETVKLERNPTGKFFKYILNLNFQNKIKKINIKLN